MSVQTTDRTFLGLGSGLARDAVFRKWTGPIAAAVNLPQGSLAGALLTDTNTSPVIRPFVADGTMRALGFVYKGIDNTSGAQGDGAPIDVLSTTGRLVDANSGGANAFVATDVFAPVYGVDNQTCSKLASAGPCIGMFCGLDSVTGEPVVLVDPVVASAMAKGNAPRFVSVPVTLAAHSNGSIAFRYTPGFAGLILSLNSYNKTPVTTAAKLATFTAAIAGTPTTGGAVALTSANCATVGSKVNGSAITAANAFTAAQEITIAASSVTAFVEGEQVLVLALLPTP